MKLKGTVAIVTGGTSGIGEAISILMAAEGATVAVVGRNEERGGNVVQRILSKGGKAFFVKADVTIKDEVQSLVSRVVREEGKMDILCNNAGSIKTGRIIEMSEDDWTALLNGNLTSAFLCSKYTIPHMMRTAGGVIINVGSAAGISGYANAAAYCSAKAALHMLTKAMALEYADYNIRVNCIAPGPIATPMAQDSLGSLENMRRKAEEKVPLKRLGSPEEVASLAVHLASDDARFITGSIFSIDGGVTAGRRKDLTLI